MIQRLKEFIDAMNMSVRSFEISIGASNGLIRKAIANNTDIQSRWLAAIIYNYPHLNVDWLLTGRGNMYINTDICSDGHKHESSKPIPLIPTDAFAGPGLPSFDDLPIEEYYDISDFYDADFIIRVKGVSMQPNYCSGDLVACRIVQETLFFQWGKIYVINTRSQGVMIKRIKRSSLEGHILLVSDNEDYDPFDVPVSDIDALAIVLGGIKLE